MLYAKVLAAEFWCPSLFSALSPTQKTGSKIHDLGRKDGALLGELGLSIRENGVTKRLSQCYLQCLTRPDMTV